MAKISGTVKWFSNKKGFGFIAPTSENSPTTEEIFVHQTSIFADGDYRTLVEGSEVEFEIETEASGKLKAVNVASPGGIAIKPPVRERQRRPRKDGVDGNKAASVVDSVDDSKDGAVTDEETDTGVKEKKGGRKPPRRRPPRTAPKKATIPAPQETETQPPKKERDPPFHDILNEDAKKKISDKGVELGQKMTIDVALGNDRIKLGQGGYAGVANANGILGEGSYTCNESGQVAFSWERCLEFIDGKWTPTGTSKLLPSFSLSGDSITSVQPDETAESLWGADKTDPKDAFVENGFKMKRVVLTRPPGGIRGGRRNTGRPTRNSAGPKPE